MALSKTRDLLSQKVGVLGSDGVTGKAVLAACGSQGISVSSIQDAQLIVASPGIPPEQYPKTNAEIISEIEFAYRLFQTQAQQPCLISTTGTNGKSTVTSLISHFLGCPVAGNIGVPLVNFVGKTEAVMSLELSSYQLELVPTFNSKVAILLNITPDHLARHKTMEKYVETKANITRNQGPDDIFIYNEKDPYCRQVASQTKARCIPISDDHPLGNLQAHSLLKGPHNALNVAASAVAAIEYGKSEAELSELISTFKPLAHRMEVLDSSLPYEFVNDSKATNPESVLMAIKGYDRPVHLLLCGKDKGLELQGFVAQCQKRVASITVFGEIGPKLQSISTQLNPSYPLQCVETMAEALNNVINTAAEGDIILLSPSSESFDQFKNFEDRGQQFKDLVSAL